MKLLGIDYGLRKIGLAVSYGNVAEPLLVLDLKNWELGISKVCREEGIEKIIVGLPGGKMDVQIREFAAKLAKKTGLLVEFQDETLTTHDALAKMREIGRKIKEEDAVSAALILQSYLDRESSV